MYPGSFDPITNGHLDIITRAAKLFEKLIIGVYDTPDKSLLFTAEERAELVRQAIVTLPNVEVRVFGGLSVSFAKEANYSAWTENERRLRKGIRSRPDEQKFVPRCRSSLSNVRPEISVP